MSGDWLTTRAAAKALGVHVNTLREWAKESAPPEHVAMKINGTRWRWHPDPQVLLRWAASQRRGR